MRGSLVVRGQALAWSRQTMRPLIKLDCFYRSSRSVFLELIWCCVRSVTVKSLLFLILFLGVCLGFLAPYLINNPDSDLMLPSSSEQVLDDDLEAGDS